MGFIASWYEAEETDPYWQFQELLEEDAELAEAVWDDMRVRTLVEKRLNSIYTKEIQSNL